MPIYEYTCDNCQENFEELVFSSSDRPSCPKCGSSSTHKNMSSPARRRSKSSGSSHYTSAPAASGCAGCSGGNCGSCGH